MTQLTRQHTFVCLLHLLLHNVCLPRTLPSSLSHVSESAGQQEYVVPVISPEYVMPVFLTGGCD